MAENKLVIKIEQDKDPENPREDDNLCQMVCFHKRYLLGDKHEYKAEDYLGWDQMMEDIKKREHPLVILPLYLYDHSGLIISTNPFNCPWDSGQIGWIFSTRKRVLQVMGFQRITKNDKENILKNLLGEVETYNFFLRGDVYGYVIEDEKGNHVDSCWGFYGEKAAKEAADDLVKHMNASMKVRDVEP